MRLSWTVFLLLRLTAANPAVADSSACDMQADMLTPSAPLTHVAAALARHRLDILAIGSGSTVGDTGGAGGPAMAYRAPGASFPFRMVDTLRDARPGTQVNLVVKGARNLTAAEMLPVLSQALAQGHFNLVLWQTGTVEAVHGARPDSLRDNLLEGAAAVAGANADLVLVDPQFSRFLRANADLGPYEAVLQQVAGIDGVTLFPRLGLTQTWISTGQVDLERAERNARDSTVSLLNTCLGVALARYVLAGAAEH